MRKYAVLTMVVLGALFLVASIAGADPVKAPAGTVVQMSVDPYVESAEVTTKVPMVPKCPCDIIFGCAFEPIGFDCAEPAHCCSCRGVNPALRMCVGVPS